MKEKNILNIISKFLYPYFRSKAVTFRAVVFYSLWAIGPVVHIFFAQELVFLIEAKDSSHFLVILGYYALFIGLFEGISFLVRKWGWVETVNAYRKTIHLEYLDRFIKLENTAIERKGTGKLISLIATGIDTWALFLDKIFENILKIIVTLIFSFYMIFLINGWYAVFFIISYFLVHIIGEYFNKRTLIHRRKRQNEWNSYTSQLVKMLMNKFEILQTNSIKKEIQNLDTITDNLGKYNIKMATPNHWFYHTPKIFVTLIKFSILGFLGYQVILGNSTLSVFVGLFGLLTLMDSVISASMQFYAQLTNSFTKIEKMWDFFENTPNINGYDKGEEFKYNNGKITLEGIAFGYTESKSIFKNFNLEIKGSSITAMVGISGGGKSTLVKLISGYIKPSFGEIIIDDQRLSDISLRSYYKNIGYLTQEPSVFDGTIMENLTYATGGNISKEKIKEILMLSKCEFIYEFENGLDTEIGEKGIRLSGGERQRLAIAKIFLKNPNIIILDEPTSALDSFSEEQITKAMHNLFKGRTVIIIAHRLQTVKDADDIILIEDGEILERGTHKSLVENNGKYKKMLDLQSGF